MLTTQKGIPTMVDDGEPKEKNAKNNEDERKEESSEEDSNYDNNR
jgi:hypothetical protein